MRKEIKGRFHNTGANLAYKVYKTVCPVSQLRTFLITSILPWTDLHEAIQVDEEPSLIMYVTHFSVL